MKLMLVDGPNMLIRAERATARVILHASETNTAALLVFVNILTRHIREGRPDAVVVCWDAGSTYRKSLYPAYKASRPSRSDSGDRTPFDLAKRFLDCAGIQHVLRDGWEADDLIAAYWQNCRSTCHLDIISSDHDLLQLIGPSVTQGKLATGGGSLHRWDENRVQTELGCRPEDLPWVMALCGDPGDGVPGLRGVGPKKAVKMFAYAQWDKDALLALLTLRAPADRETVLLAWNLVDLRERPYVGMGLIVPAPTIFCPPTIEDSRLVDFLRQYELQSVLGRLAAGSLWGMVGV